jgi:hypothetical protein
MAPCMHRFFFPLAVSLDSTHVLNTYAYLPQDGKPSYAITDNFFMLIKNI